MQAAVKKCRCWKHQFITKKTTS